MKTILKIQELERKIAKLKESTDNSRENALFEQIRENRKAIRDNLQKMEHSASMIAKEFEKINQRYEQLTAKSEIVSKQKPAMANVDNIGTILEDANYLTSELATLETKIKDLQDKAALIVKESDVAKITQRDMKAKQDKVKAIIDEKQASVLPQINELEAEIKALEPKANKELYEKYKSMRAHKIFPVFVPLRNNCCGGCSMEQSLHFVQTVRQAGILACENCGRIILSND